MQYAVCSIQYVVYSIQYTVYSIQYTAYTIQYTVSAWEEVKKVFQCSSCKLVSTRMAVAAEQEIFSLELYSE